ncbi:MAG: hypothetical protein JSV35_00110 [Candidatus Bathyarchaeota archaeon]|nr:MAG: hypothetical protein JSV35_00110 [Candidatus Bathyarchaeota archaeon]
MRLGVSNKPQTTGIIILFVGVALLVFTFLNAFLFLQRPVSIIASSDLARIFGDAMAPLIQACIHLMYLGVMGWIGSLLTLRSIPLVKQKATYAPQVLPPPPKARKHETTPVEEKEEIGVQLIPEPEHEEETEVLVTTEDLKED